MKFILEIDCVNDIFFPAPHDEISRILQQTADKFRENDIDEYALKDINGNTVGKAVLLGYEGVDKP